ncbi:MAG: diadenylate cyclase [Acutalibacteraceae bacterium]
MQTKLGDIIDSGTVINAQPSAQIIGNIFFNKAPLHDGAMVIRDGMICAAGCILPLTKSDKVSVSLGTRHRAALGMSEVSDAIVVVVSEETGQISLARQGVLARNFTKDTLKSELEKLILSQYANKNTGETNRNDSPPSERGKRNEQSTENSQKEKVIWYSQIILQRPLCVDFLHFGSHCSLVYYGYRQHQRTAQSDLRCTH